jgi:NADH-quinone oxidoreductase subunit L
MKPGAALTRGFSAIDEKVVDGAVKGLGVVVFEISNGIKKLQNGYVRSYALLMSVGILALLATVWVVTL